LQGPCKCSGGHESVRRGRKGVNKGRESAHSDYMGSPKRLREYKTLSRPQQHSHRREKVLVNSLLQAKRVLVYCRGLKSALEAVRVSVEAVRVSVEAVKKSIEA
jgi:hypothetical protein